MKLNLGSGPQKIPGYLNIDRVNGQEAYPLDYPDNSVDEIRASHILEHFKQDDVAAVLRDWVRALKPGGILRIAVPNFRWIVEKYLNGASLPIGSYILGGQQHDDDFHRSIFDEEALTHWLEGSGLRDIQPWKSEINDCAAYELSLNLQGRKPTAEEAEESGTLEVAAKVAALMSVPRLGWQDNFGACFTALKRPEFDIPLWRYSGAFWEMGIQRGLVALIEQNVDWAITIDYDTVFDSSDIKELLTLAALYPEADAIVPLQAKRGGDVMLFTMRDAYGKLRRNADASEFEGDLTPIHTGHFGLTLIKLAALQKIPKPWFWSQPTPEGEWGEGRIDADIYFWQHGEEHGLRAFQANNIRIGHLQVVASWITKDFEIIHQHLSQYQETGKPEACR